MTPRWLALLCCVILVCSPTEVSAQLVFIKTAFCAVWSASFVAANCAPCERLMCRILASRIKKFCTTFPCTNYGSPSSNKCTSLPFGCLPWHIRPLGLCQPFKFCCEKKSKADSKTQQHYSLSSVIKQRIRQTTMTNTSRSSNSNPIPKFLIPRSNESSAELGKEEQLLTLLRLWNQSEAGVMNIGPFHLPLPPEEYMDGWPDDDQDPVSVENTIKQQYDTLVQEVQAINMDEIEHGGEAVGIPEFDEFRSMALGEKLLQW